MALLFDFSKDDPQSREGIA